MRAWTPAVLAVTLLAEPAATPVPPTAQTTPPITRRELVATEVLRVALVEIAAGAAVPVHEHGEDHLLVTLTAGELVEQVEGQEPRRMVLAEGALDLVPAGRRHALTNGRAEPFRGVTVDLLRAQTGARNRCARLLPSSPIDCPAPAHLPPGIAVRPQLTSDQTEISLLTLAPGARLALPGSADPPAVIALAGTEALALVEVKVAGASGVGERELRAGDAFALPPGTGVELCNTGSRDARFLVVDPLAP